MEMTFALLYERAVFINKHRQIVYGYYSRESDGS